MIKGSTHRLPETVAPPAGAGPLRRRVCAHRLPETVAPPAGKGYAKLAALRTADEMAAVRGTAPQAGTGGVRPCAMTGSGHPAGAAFSGDTLEARDGGGQERMAPALPLRRQPIFRRLAARPRPEKRKEPTCAALPPSLPGPRFILSLPSGTGKTASLSAPSPGSSRCPAVALPAPLLR